MGIRSLRWSNHRFVTLAFAAATTLTIGIAAPSAAASEQVGPEFIQFHDESGGTAVFGDALSPRVIEDGSVTQYFERQRVELHEENAAPYDVLLGRLGSEEAQRRGLTESDAFAPVGGAESADADCTYFAQTDQQVCGAFEDLWTSNGASLGDAGISDRESLALFGYPISQEFTDPDTGLTTQYFERARFEYNQNTGEVSLGRVGAQAWAEKEGSAELAPEPEPVAESAPAPEPETEPANEAAPEPESEPEPQVATTVGGATGSFVQPTTGTITQNFGYTATAASGMYGGAGHSGMDIANAINTPINAADGGQVTQAGWMGGYGYAVVIDHGNGFETLYGHMAGQPAVGVGQTVSQGQYIGPMGSTGNSTGSHLHFEVKLNGVAQNPAGYIH